MSLASVLPPVDPAPLRRRRFASRGLRSMAAGLAIGVLLWGASGGELWPSIVHSLCIATCCWLCIDLGRIPLARWKHRNDPPGGSEALSRWPGWPLMMVAVVIGSLAGFALGAELAHLILGRPTAPGYFRDNWRVTLSVLITSLVPGTLITYWFYSRETIAAQEAATQAAQRQAAEHQLKLLESQLEPHMLFNTLANLRVLIGLDPPRAQAMLDQLIAFLRAMLAGSRAGLHPLRAEFGRLADYLALMRMRMGDRLASSFELPEALADVPVPPLLLQPLVENAIRHGLEPKIEGGRIEVQARRDGKALVLVVRDTGAGVQQPAASSDGSRFGLVQVRERLQTLYGSAASLTLDAAPDGEAGAIATIRLPLATAVAAPAPTAPGRVEPASQPSGAAPAVLAGRPRP